MFNSENEQLRDFLRVEYPNEYLRIRNDVHITPALIESITGVKAEKVEKTGFLELPNVTEIFSYIADAYLAMFTVRTRTH